MILRNARLYNEDFDLIEADLELEGKTIKAVLPRGTKVEGAKEVDLTGKKILPGFIDIHIHGSNGADQGRHLIPTYHDDYTCRRAGQGVCLEAGT